MSVVIIGEKNKAPAAPYYERKIRCPGHYLIPPTVDIYKREPVYELKNVSKGVIQHYKIKTWRRKRDKFGRPIIDFKKLYELQRKGIVLQPEISASFAIEHIYDPKGLLCRLCDKRCLEGKGRINEFSIKRLHSK